MILLPLLITLAIGFLSVRLICRNTLPVLLQGALGSALGFGLVGLLTFYQLIIVNNHDHWLTVLLSVSMAITLFTFNYRAAFKPAPTLPLSTTIIICVSGIILALLLFVQATNYPLGGWDAWSCWNLKARFMFLSADNWRTMFTPELWRSNTHYPLLLPSIIAFGWQWIGNADQLWPMTCTIVFTVSTLMLISLTLLHRGASLLLSIALPLSIFTIPFSVTLSISQYSDILVGLYTVGAIACLLLGEKNSSLLTLTGIFIGLLSFTKSEGLVAAGLLTALTLLLYPKSRNVQFIVGLILTGLATVIFQLTIAPHNEAFINGLSSIDKPSTLERLQVILIYPWLEVINLKWQGLWIALGLGFLLYIKNAFTKNLLIFCLFILSYLTIVAGFYYVNTFFDIIWWLNTTLHRILFALLPTIVLWLGLSTINKENA